MSERFRDDIILHLLLFFCIISVAYLCVIVYSLPHPQPPFFHSFESDGTRISDTSNDRLSRYRKQGSHSFFRPAFIPLQCGSLEPREIHTVDCRNSAYRAQHPHYRSANGET